MMRTNGFWRIVSRSPARTAVAMRTIWRADGASTTG